MRLDPTKPCTDAARHQETLVQDGCYIGRSLVCGHVRVIMRSGGERIEFRDESGGILRVIRLSQSVVVRAETA